MAPVPDKGRWFRGKGNPLFPVKGGFPFPRASILLREKRGVLNEIVFRNAQQTRWADRLVRMSRERSVTESG